MSKIYIAGPMKGYPNSNIEAFDSAAEKLRALGHEVINPADITRSNPVEGVGSDGSITPEAYRRYVILDIVALLECDTMVVLERWGESKGATLEYRIARQLDMPVYRLPDFLAGQDPIDPTAFTWKLSYDRPVLQIETY